MIKNILLVFLLLLVVWLSRDSLRLPLALAPAPSVQDRQLERVVPTVSDMTIHNNSVAHIKIPTSVKHPTSKDKTKNITIASLLAKNKFYDALSLYFLDSTSAHRHLFEVYLAQLAKHAPTQALEYMQIFLDNAPQSNMLALMIQTYLSQKEYPSAMKRIQEAKEDYKNEKEDQKLSKLLKETAIKNITLLTKEKDFTALIAFLEEMIAYDNDDSFYPFQLAQVYMQLDKKEEAIALLSELEYDEVYAQKAKTMLASIDIEEDVGNQYDYAIPLQKYGEHYVVNVFLDGIAFRLMLDTGATYIYIDEAKASSLAIVNSHLQLQTAGGDISAKLRKAENMRVGDLELHDIKLTSAPFNREDIDGLLGMNFLNKFAFFIDQESNTLYLTSKTK